MSLFKVRTLQLPHLRFDNLNVGSGRLTYMPCISRHSVYYIHYTYTIYCTLYTLYSIYHRPYSLYMPCIRRLSASPQVHIAQALRDFGRKKSPDLGFIACRLCQQVLRRANGCIENRPASFETVSHAKYAEESLGVMHEPALRQKLPVIKFEVLLCFR